MKMYIVMNVVCRYVKPVDAAIMNHVNMHVVLKLKRMNVKWMNQKMKGNKKLLKELEEKSKLLADYKRLKAVWGTLGQSGWRKRYLDKIKPKGYKTNK